MNSRSSSDPSAPPSGQALGTLEQALEAAIERVVRRVVREEIAAIHAGPNGEPALITMREFARRHSISETTVRTMIRDGRLNAVKIGASVRIRPDAPIGKPAPRFPDVETHATRIDRILRTKP